MEKAKNTLRPRIFDFPVGDLVSLLPRMRPRDRPVFLDSSGGPPELARFSYLAWSPFAQLTTREGKSTWQEATGRAVTREENPVEALETALGAFALEREGLELPFLGGALGWFSYELGGRLESLPPAPPDDLQLPEISLGFYDRFLVLDHQSQTVSAVILEHEGSDRSGKAYLEATLEEMKQVLQQPLVPADCLPGRELVADQSREEYFQAVGRAKRYIREGDIYQVNLSQRFDLPYAGSSAELYRRLRESNPAPFSAFLSTPNTDVFSSSPERFLRIRGREIETRPIKGTRPRCGQAEPDQKAREELLASAKDRAELTMIIDLERNDLKRLCETGSVQVPRLYGLEEYATVFHLVSTVQGTLRPGIGIGDCLRATFPGGSITGAPKIRSMEIIAELEKSARGIYTGAIGWIGFDGDCDLNIAIRTMVRNEDRIVFRSGGGIVADSDPRSEYEETFHKARGLARALGVELPA